MDDECGRDESDTESQYPVFAVTRPMDGQVEKLIQALGEPALEESVKSPALEFPCRRTLVEFVARGVHRSFDSIQLTMLSRAVASSAARCSRVFTMDRTLRGF